LWLFWLSSVLPFGSLELIRPFSCSCEGAELGPSAYPLHVIAPALRAADNRIKLVERLESTLQGVQLEAFAVSNPDCAIPTM
jgi:hypothetical protein